MSILIESVAKSLRYLAQSRNSDGGWPYLRGKQSALEPTCYSALACSWQRPAAEVERAVGWLSSPGHLIGAKPDTHAFLALGLLALIRLNQKAELRANLSAQLLQANVRTIPGNPGEAASPRGWSWVTDTFSWVEPTSYVLIALKSAGYEKHKRIAEAESMLLNRGCAAGGWNYGDLRSSVRGACALPPTTALAAIALQNLPQAKNQIAKALDVMDHEVRAHPSTISLALTILGFNIFGRSPDYFSEALCARQSTDGSWRGQVHLTALAALALRAAEENHNVFKLT